MTRIREATAEDVPDLARVYVDTWRSIYAGVLPEAALVGMSYARQDRYWSRLVGSGRGIVVAEVENRVVGFASAGRTRDPGLSYAGEVYTLYLLDDYHGRGLGRALLTASFRDLQDRGFASALIWSLALNPSRFFYETLGGRCVAERMTALWGASLREIGYGWPDLAKAGLVSARRA